MEKLSKEQFYQVMNILSKHLSNHVEYLYHNYKFTGRLEGYLEEFKHELEKSLSEITDLD